MNTVNITNEKKSPLSNVASGPTVMWSPCQMIKIIAPKRHVIINEIKRPLQFPLLIFNFLIVSIDFLYLAIIKASLVKVFTRSEEHTSELQSRPHLVCR